MRDIVAKIFRKKKGLKHMLFIPTQDMLILVATYSLLRVVFSFAVSDVKLLILNSSILCAKLLILITCRLLHHTPHQYILLVIALFLTILYEICSGGLLSVCLFVGTKEYGPLSIWVIDCGSLRFKTYWSVLFLFLCTGLGNRLVASAVFGGLIVLIMKVLVSGKWYSSFLDIGLYLIFSLIGIIYYCAIFCIGLEICRIRNFPLKSIEDLPYIFFQKFEPAGLQALPLSIINKELSRSEHLYILLRVTKLPKFRNLALQLMSVDCDDEFSVTEKNKLSVLFLRNVLLHCFNSDNFSDPSSQEHAALSKSVASGETPRQVVETEKNIKTNKEETPKIQLEGQKSEDRVHYHPNLRLPEILAIFAKKSPWNQNGNPPVFLSDLRLDHETVHDNGFLNMVARKLQARKNVSNEMIWNSRHFRHVIMNQYLEKYCDEVDCVEDVHFAEEEAEELHYRKAIFLIERLLNSGTSTVLVDDIKDHDRREEVEQLVSGSFNKTFENLVLSEPSPSSLVLSSVSTEDASLAQNSSLNNGLRSFEKPAIREKENIFKSLKHPIGKSINDKHSYLSNFLTCSPGLKRSETGVTYAKRRVRSLDKLQDKCYERIITSKYERNKNFLPSTRWGPCLEMKYAQMLNKGKCSSPAMKDRNHSVKRSTGKSPLGIESHFANILMLRKMKRAQIRSIERKRILKAYVLHRYLPLSDKNHEIYNDTKNSLRMEERNYIEDANPFRKSCNFFASSDPGVSSLDWGTIEQETDFEKFSSTEYPDVNNPPHRKEKGGRRSTALFLAWSEKFRRRRAIDNLIIPSKKGISRGGKIDVASLQNFLHNPMLDHIRELSTSAIMKNTIISRVRWYSEKLLSWLDCADVVMMKARWKSSDVILKTDIIGRFVDRKIERWFLSWLTTVQARHQILLQPLILFEKVFNLVLIWGLFLIGASQVKGTVSILDSEIFKKCLLYLSIRTSIGVGIFSVISYSQRLGNYRGSSNSHMFKVRALFFSIIRVILSISDTVMHQILLSSHYPLIHFLAMAATPFAAVSMATTGPTVWVMTLNFLCVIFLLPTIQSKTTGTKNSIYFIVYSFVMVLWSFFAARSISINYRLIFVRYVLPYVLYLDALSP